MLPYLTPERYRAMGLGTTDQDDEALLSLINRASLAVDRYVSAPLTPSRFSFRGGTVTDEEHPFRLGDGVGEVPTRIIWPRCTPVRAVTSLRVYVTTTQYVDFDPADLFITKDNVQIISVTLTSASFFGAIAVPVLGLTTPIARISYSYGYDFDSVEEMLASTEGTTWRAQNQFWNDDTPEVKLDGVVMVDADYTLNKTEGTVILDDPQPDGAMVTASYGYTMPGEVGQATGLTVSDFVSKKELFEKGMGSLEALRVGEISMERPRARAAISNRSVNLPDEAKQLLDGLHFMTLR